ncbi:MAG: STAS domain-containing protein [Geothermobacteraceae bacterium]
MTDIQRLSGLISTNKERLTREWIDRQKADLGGRLTVADMERDARGFFDVFEADLAAGSLESMPKTRAYLEQLSRDRIERGFSPTAIAGIFFSLKKPIFSLLSETLGDDPTEVLQLTLTISEHLDRIAMEAIDLLVQAKEKIIRQQQEEMLELSTPTVKLWDGILALPLIGTLDSARTQSIMESLLETIVATSSTVAILDITGVPTVDTMVAQHILKTVAAARLMGTECLISGIRPAIAQTMVHLGVGFKDVTTKASLSEALLHAFTRRGLKVVSG